MGEKGGGGGEVRKVVREKSENVQVEDFAVGGTGMGGRRRWGEGEGERNAEEQTKENRDGVAWWER